MSTFWKQHHNALNALSCGLLVAVCYGFALRLPFFFDDLPVMTWVNHHSLVDIWTGASEQAYFRPLTFSVYKFGLLFPFGMRQPVLHAINLFLFWLSSVLIQRIVRLAEKGPGQALLATYAALRAGRDRSIWWWGVCLLAIALAPLAHESGVTCGAIAGGVVLLPMFFLHGLVYPAFVDGARCENDAALVAIISVKE